MNRWITSALRDSRGPGQHWTLLLHVTAARGNQTIEMGTREKEKVKWPPDIHSVYTGDKNFGYLVLLSMSITASQDRLGNSQRSERYGVFQDCAFPFSWIPFFLASALGAAPYPAGVSAFGKLRQTFCGSVKVCFRFSWIFIAALLFIYTIYKRSVLQRLALFNCWIIVLASRGSTKLHIELFEFT